MQPAMIIDLSMWKIGPIWSHRSSRSGSLEDRINISAREPWGVNMARNCERKIEENRSSSSDDEYAMLDMQLAANVGKTCQWCVK